MQAVCSIVELESERDTKIPMEAEYDGNDTKRLIPKSKHDKKVLHHHHHNSSACSSNPWLSTYPLSVRITVLLLGFVMILGNILFLVAYIIEDVSPLYRIQAVDMISGNDIKSGSLLLRGFSS